MPMGAQSSFTEIPIRASPANRSPASAEAPGSRAASLVNNDQGSGLRAQGSGLRAQGSGLKAQGSRLRAQGSGLKEALASKGPSKPPPPSTELSGGRVQCQHLVRGG